ncbi:hypothetical protein BEN49_14250 [Hymenobacter coccineus]|uniref:Uncharacterized protein n=1 Tax=Hymenobacter coccineus TaxID=1908235 RepID=A0A1G1SUE9_9BACT|nr:hypothetical protein BEN49_14250 [Hymenobacter coccineus]
MAARYRAQWLAHSVLRGGLVFAVLLWFWPAETRALSNGLLALAGAAPVSAGALGAVAHGLGPLVLAGHALLWASYCLTRQASLALADGLEVLLLGFLLVALPPVLSAGVYFVFWHSLQYVLRTNALMSRPLPVGCPGWGPSWASFCGAWPRCWPSA